MLQCSECTAGEIRMASPRPTPQLYPDRRVHSKHAPLPSAKPWPENPRGGAKQATEALISDDFGANLKAWLPPWIKSQRMPLGCPPAAGACWSKNCSPVLQAKPIPPWNAPIWTKYVAAG